MLKQILGGREFSSSDEIEDTIAHVWDDLTLDDVQIVFRDWVRALVWVAENDGEYISESKRFASSCRLHVEIGMGRGTFWTHCIIQDDIVQ
jgi:hypothetical protein